MISVLIKIILITIFSHNPTCNAALGSGLWVESDVLHLNDIQLGFQWREAEGGESRDGRAAVLEVCVHLASRELGILGVHKSAAVRHTLGLTQTRTGHLSV